MACRVLNIVELARGRPGGTADLARKRSAAIRIGTLGSSNDLGDIGYST